MSNADEAEIEWYINRNHPFDPPGPYTPPVQQQRTEAPKSNNNLRDLRGKLFTPAGHFKYTCTFCEGEYDSSKVRDWYRKPAAGRMPVPVCPICSNCGAMSGWGHDFSYRRREWGEYSKARKEREKKAIELNTQNRKEREEKLEEENYEEEESID